MSVLGPGSLVRCVDVSALSRPILIVGHVYRVRRAWLATNGGGISLDILTLQEFPDEKTYWFVASRFVPVDDGAIDVFRDLLAPAPKERTTTREKEKA